VSDLSVRLFGLTAVAQEGESVTPSFDTMGSPKRPDVFPKYATVGFRLACIEVVFWRALMSQAAFQSEDLALGQHDVDPDQQTSRQRHPNLVPVHSK
jgi:hypothetical protein